VSGTSSDRHASAALRPGFWAAWVLVVVALGALAAWGWVALVPGFLRNPDIPYMERVLSPILYTFLLLLMGAGGAVLAAAAFLFWERRLRARVTRATDPHD